MVKLSLMNPTIKDVLLFVCPYIVVGDFSFITAAGKLVMCHDQYVEHVWSITYADYYSFRRTTIR